MRRSAFVSTVAVALLAAACEKSPSAVPFEDGASFGRSVNAIVAQDEVLRSVRQATARFNSTDQAIAAGYLPSNHCVAHPALGGMGYHWVNPGLVDGVLDPRQPEMMLYAPDHDGNLRLVGVEYIVMAGEGVDLAGPARPRLGNQPLDIGGTPNPAPHWSLHVWIYEDNPSGMFTPFNPNVSCGGGHGGH
jgi:hypothetical protein